MPASGHEKDDAARWLVPPGQVEAWERQRSGLVARISTAFHKQCSDSGISGPLDDTLWRVYIPLALWILGKHEEHRRHSRAPLVVGITAPPGAGKSRLSRFVRLILETGCEKRVAIVGLDDLYKSHADPQLMARNEHVLFRTRGVPGTHELQFALLRVFAQLFSASAYTMTGIPCFSKEKDDRAPENEWEQFRGRPDIILFEGWCVGARPQPDRALERPINSLEETEDPDGDWRRRSNRYLREEYPPLFNLIDVQVMILPPSWEVAVEQRREQEQKERPSRMPRCVFDRFLLFYERLSRALMQDMPDKCDVLLEIDARHNVTNVVVRPPTKSDATGGS